MKRLAVLTCLAAAAICSASAADQRIAFEQDASADVANLQASLIRKLGEGIFPAISPDAKTIAFTTVTSAGTSYVRRIATLEIATGARRVFESLPTDNAYYCGWSPDGQWIAFTLRSEGVWNLGLIKADGTGFKFIKKGDQNTVTLFSPCWSRDGKSIFCQDMTSIYRLDLDGAVIAQWKIAGIVPNGSMSGDGRIDVSPDGHRLLLSVDMDEEYARQDWDGPVPALWSLDLITQVAVRLTAKSLFAWDGCWIDDANLLFVSQRPDDKKPAIYRTKGKSLKRLIKNARRPSVSRP